MGKTGEMHTKFWWGNLMERDNLEDIGVDGRIIMHFKGVGRDGMEWISRTQDRGK